jgi:hypothetical protein
MCKHYAPRHEQQGLELERIGDVGMYVVGNGSGWSIGGVVVRCCSLFLGILLKDFWTLGAFSFVF